MKTKKLLREMITILILIVMAVSGIFFANELIQVIKSNEDANTIKKIVMKTTTTEAKYGKDTYEALKKANDDTIGFLAFDSGLIEQPIVQADNNDYYLNHAFNKEYSQQGAIFIDSDMSFADHNPVIYGHNVIYDSNAKFSPLLKMVEQDYYETNNTFNIYRENDVMEYEVIAVYTYNINNLSSFNYIRPNFESEEEFVNWFNSVITLNEIEPSFDYPTYEDRLLTLQTCAAYNSPRRVIIVAKLSNINSYK